MGEIWFAGPKSGRATYYNAVPVSKMGYVLYTVCFFGGMFFAQRFQRTYFDDKPFFVELIAYLAVFVPAFLLFQILAKFIFRKHVDFADRCTDCNGEELTREVDGEAEL